MRTTYLQRMFVGLGLMAAMSIGFEAGSAARVDDHSTPVIARVVPGQPEPGKDPQSMTIEGQDLQPRLSLMVTTPEGGSIEYKDDAIKPQGDTAFQVAILFATAGKYSLVVTNRDGGISHPYALEVKAVVKPPTPVIQHVMPEVIAKSPEPQDLTVEGQRFGPGLKAIVTDPLGVEVLDAIVRDVTTSSFKLNVKLEIAGPYNLVVRNTTGAVSNVVTFTVR